MGADIERVLITGGCGFIGSNLVRFLAERTTWKLRALDDLRTGRLEYVREQGPAEVHTGSVADREAVRRALAGVDTVVHLASQTGVQPSVEDPAGDFEGNLSVTFSMLEASRAAGVERFVFASSGAAVGEVNPIHEEVVPKPLSPYGAGKLAGEAYCRAFAASFGLHTVALRFSNVYGPFSAHKRNAVPNFVKRSLTGEPIVIYGDGSQTRDFVYVEDLCDAIHRALTTGGIAGEVFQVARGVETSVADLAALVKEVTGSASEIRFEPKRSGEVYKSRADISKARRVLGFDPTVDLREGIARTADWYRQHWLPTAAASTPA